MIVSKYTTELRYICETASGLNNSVGYRGIDEVISSAIPEVFSFDFPIFDEDYRNVLCRKILKHYYTREICEETVGLWKLRLDTKMNEIMPYYNQLYRSELIKFNPMYDTEITRESKRINDGEQKDEYTSDRTNTDSGETNTEVNGINKNNVNETTEEKATNTNQTNTRTEGGIDKVERDLYSDTPQGGLTGVENEEYLTNARKKIGNETNTQNAVSNGESGSDINGVKNIVENGETSNTGKTTTTNTNNDIFNSTQGKKHNSTEDYLETVSGKQGGLSYSKLLKEFRDTFLNIDMLIINDLSDLFFGLW